jgi:OmpA-OmpF porin, OOP family
MTPYPSSRSNVGSAGRALGASLAAVAAVAAFGGAASADPTAGVDTALFRSSYDTGGIFSLEGARLMPARDISWKVLMSYAKSPLNAAVPGIGDTSADSVLDYVAIIDMAFGMSITDRFAIGMDVAAYRTATSDGYGTRGLYNSNPDLATLGTGLMSLRRFSNIDQSNTQLDDGLAGPLDVRLGAKLALMRGERAALTLVGTATLPFGEEEMLLGDSSFMFEPKLAFDFRLDRIKSSKVVLNLGARLRKRTILQSSLPEMSRANPQAWLDVGSEALAGAGFLYEISPRLVAGAEATVLFPLPASMSFGDCRLSNGSKCSDMPDSTYFEDAEEGDLTLLATGGLQFRFNDQVAGTVMAGTGQVGARGDDFRVTTGIIWSPQPGGASGISRSDRDGDGVPDGSDACASEAEDRDGYQDEDGCPDGDNDNDSIADAKDKCPDEPEDRDGYQDEDGCPEPDNESDGIPDVSDRCPDQKEDIDGFDDGDGCPDEDNDLDGFADGVDKCPNDPETVNGIDDEDGCPDSRGSGPEDRGDRLDLKGGQVTFRGATVTPIGKQVLRSVAQLMRDRSLVVRVEVHVPLGTRSKRARDITRQKQQDRQLTIKRATAVLEFLASQGVPLSQIQAAGLGSDRPLGTNAPTDPANERVDFIKAQQRTP